MKSNQGQPRNEDNKNGASLTEERAIFKLVDKIKLKKSNVEFAEKVEAKAEVSKNTRRNMTIEAILIFFYFFIRSQF